MSIAERQARWRRDSELECLRAEVTKLREEVAELRALRNAASAPMCCGGIGKQIVRRFADGKWHDIEIISKYVNATVESLDSVFQNMRDKGAYGIGLCERRQHAKAIQYRMRKAGRTIDLAVLMKELKPILEGLKAEGKKNMTTMSPGAVGYLVGKAKQLIERLAKQPASD